MSLKVLSTFYNCAFALISVLMERAPSISKQGTGIMTLYSTVILILIIPGYECDLSVNVSSNYSDTCDYTNSKYPCGDICVGYVDYWLGKCTCGDQVIGGWDEWIPGSKILGSLTPKYCCTPPPVQCTKTLFGANCPEGEVLDAGGQAETDG